MAETAASVESAKKKRKAKDLPDCVAALTEQNFRKLLKFRFETDPQGSGDARVAYEVTGAAGDDDNSSPTTSFLLDKPTSDQLCTLCKNVGVRYVNRTKFGCRKALWIEANEQETREKDGLRIATASERASSNTIRLVNVLFSNNFYDSFIKLNDVKNRTDHETGGMPSDFWSDVAEAINGDSSDDPSPLQTIIPPGNPHFDELNDLDLENFDNMTSEVLRKRFNLLLKVRNVMKQNMTTSGEHDSDSYNFVDVAMKKVGGANSLTWIGCYYFFERCAEKKQDIDDTFGHTMDDILMGSTEAPLEVDDSSITADTTPVAAVASGRSSSSTRSTKYKHGDSSAIVDLSGSVAAIAKEFVETNKIGLMLANASEKQNEIASQSADALEKQNDIASKSADAQEHKNRLTEQGQRIQLAQLLGDQDMLQSILSSMEGQNRGQN